SDGGDGFCAARVPRTERCWAVVQVHVLTFIKVEVRNIHAGFQAKMAQKAHEYCVLQTRN
ncbi:MAG: hypothetical protein ACRCV9_09805, partial [Burkholderiaceae bacterium]